MARLVVLLGDELCGVHDVEAEVTIGRKRFNDVVLGHNDVSAAHARLYLGEEGYLVEDLGSRAGTLVAGRPISGPTLVDGRTGFQVGPYRLLLDPGGSPDRGAGPAAPPVAGLGSESEAYKLLEAIFALDEKLAAASGGPDLLAPSLDCLMEIFAARRGIVFTYRDDGLLPVALRPAGDADAGLSRRLLEQLVALEEPALIRDVAEDPRTQGLDSIACGVTSIIASPLREGGRRLGLLYLESAERGRPFSRRDLAFLRSFCAYAGRVVARAGQARRLDALSRIHRLQMPGGGDFEGLVGRSEAARRIFRQIDEVAGEDVTTLVTGETGTGKELIARAIHDRSVRAAMPFVPVHCMALSPELVESELFGHCKGAFTGAVEERIGRLEMAQGGTLFLDEVGELAPAVQVKLLRVLEERTYERVGEGRPRELDVRLICATNADLTELVRGGRFREDLYYRICVFLIAVPPLRERREDIPFLVEHFVRACNRRMRKHVDGVDDDAMRSLAAYDWPGNVRELRNVIEQAFVRAQGRHITAACVPSVAAFPAANAGFDIGRYPADFEAARRQFEEELIRAYLEKNDGNLAATARDLKTSRRNLYRKVTGPIRD